MPPKPSLSKQQAGIFGVILMVAVVLARYVGVAVPECPVCPCAAAASSAP